jgi:pseudouridine kinase
VSTVLLTAVSDDDAGARILGQAAGSGIDVSETLVVRDRPSSAYMALLALDGSLDVAVDDMGCIAALTPAYLESKRPLFQQAAMAVVDANLSPDVLATVVRLCRACGVPLCADPTSVVLSERLRPHLASLDMITPNVLETRILCDASFAPNDPEAAMSAAKRLLSAGVKIAIVALAEFGVVYASAETTGQIPALQTQIADPTGAGDAMTAAIIFGLLEGIPLDECVRLGVTAASLTLRTHDTVRPDLSVDLLYDELVI